MQGLFGADVVGVIQIKEREDGGTADRLVAVVVKVSADAGDENA